jgi:hypothetical protein
MQLECRFNFTISKFPRTGSFVQNHDDVRMQLQCGCGDRLRNGAVQRSLDGIGFAGT